MKSIIVGFGRIANSIRHDAKISKVFRYASHAQVLAEHPAFEWVGIVDPGDVAEAAAEWGKPVGTLEDFQEAEFAAITAPPAARLGIVSNLPALKAVMIEKPLGDEGEAFLKYCKGREISVSVNFWRRGVRYYRDLDLRKQVGQVQAVFCTYGNGLMNNGSHLIDFLQMLFGDIECAAHSEVDTLESLGCSGPMDDYSVNFVLRAMEGMFPILGAPIDFNDYREVSVDIWGTKGRLFIGQESLQVCKYPVVNHRGMENQKEVSATAFTTERVDVSDSIWNLYTSIAEGNPLSPGEGALKTERILKGLIS